MAAPTVTVRGVAFTVAYEQFDPGDPGAWTLRRDGEQVDRNTRLQSRDEAGALTWAESAALLALDNARLPTAADILTNARAELGHAAAAVEAAADWLRSDWSPVGSALTDMQAAERTRLREIIGATRRALQDAQ